MKIQIDGMNLALLTARGSATGAGATILMSAVMAAGKAAGLLTTPPPKQISLNAGRKADLHPGDKPKSVVTAGWIASHFAFGSGCGVLFTALRRWLPAPAPVAGALYGLAVWGVSYLGLMPALGLYPTPENDRKSRTAVMIVAHLVYGWTVAALNPKND